MQEVNTHSCLGSVPVHMRLWRNLTPQLCQVDSQILLVALQAHYYDELHIYCNQVAS